jgi:anti-sigma regulatory factor (Ser/Thr protein kinase)
MGKPAIESPTSCQFALGPHADAAPCARLAVQEALVRWGLPELLEDARLIAGELVTNAAKLGEDFRFVLTREDEALLIEVFDSSEAEPVVRDAYADASSEDGRGMMLVTALAADWGVRRQSRGKSVWARVSR